MELSKYMLIKKEKSTTTTCQKQMGMVKAGRDCKGQHYALS